MPERVYLKFHQPVCLHENPEKFMKFMPTAHTIIHVAWIFHVPFSMAIYTDLIRAAPGVRTNKCARFARANKRMRALSDVHVYVMCVCHTRIAQVVKCTEALGSFRRTVPHTHCAPEQQHMRLANDANTHVCLRVKQSADVVCIMESLC